MYYKGHISRKTEEGKEKSQDIPISVRITGFAVSGVSTGREGKMRENICMYKQEGCRYL